MKLKLIVASLLASAAIATTQAQTVQFTGFTNGAFNGPATSTNGAFQTTSFQGLTFYSSTFNKQTAGGFAAFGGNPVAGPGNVQNFGAVSLSSLSATYTNNSFSLLISFTAPPVVGGQTFTAMLLGVVNTTGAGGVTFNFDNTPRLITASNGVVFRLTVNDLSLDPDQTGAFSGDVQVVTVPEGGATVALLGLSLVGIAAVRRHRIKG